MRIAHQQLETTLEGYRAEASDTQATLAALNDQLGKANGNVADLGAALAERQELETALEGYRAESADTQATLAALIDLLAEGVSGGVLNAGLATALGLSQPLSDVLYNALESESKAMAKAAVVENLTPICVEQYLQDPNKLERFAELKKEPSYRKDNYVRDIGWATMPGAESPVRGVPDACAKRIIELAG